MFLLLLQVVTTRPAPPALAWDGVIDVYGDAGSPRSPGGLRTWMTQPRADRAFALNLAALGATWTADRVRARVSIQGGSSVVANYAGEPDPEGVRMFEEAYVGARAGKSLWIDAGIFGSAIGMESWRSTEDPTYTRSLTGDLTPYYSAGVRGTWQASAVVALRLDLVNGWQRIGENNDAKALSARVDWTPRSTLLLGGSAFIGNERPEAATPATRSFGQVYARIGAADRAAAWLTADLGSEAASRWRSLTAIVRRPLTPSLAMSVRGEYYSDPDQVVFATGTGNGFEGVGASLGVDVTVVPGVQWRTEGRWLSSRDAVFANADGGPKTGAGFVVTALTFRWAGND